MKVGTLCSGYEGFGLALGFDPSWVCEYEAAPSRVLAHHHPDAPNLGDLTAVDWSAVEPVDLICAGYPCQPFSHAGQRKGTTDARHLWPHVADAVRVLRPRLVFLENVAGHLSLGFGDVLGDLAEAGYDARWRCVRASDVGAPHRRERVFIVAADAGRRGFDGGPKQDLDPNEPRLAAPRRDDAHRLGVATDWREYGPAIERWERILDRAAPPPVDDTGRRLNPPFVEWMMGLPAGWVTDLGLPRTAELKMLGNGIVPQQARAAWLELVDDALGAA